MSDKNIQTIQRVYEAFGKGDVPSILEFCTDDVAWGLVHDGADGVPWHKQLEGRREVPQFFEALSKECIFSRFDVEALASNGEYVYATIDYDVTVKKTGLKASLLGMHRFAFTNGRIREWVGFEDTAHVLKLWNG